MRKNRNIKDKINKKAHLPGFAVITAAAVFMCSSLHIAEIALRLARQGTEYSFMEKLLDECAGGEKSVRGSENSREPKDCPEKESCGGRSEESSGGKQTYEMPAEEKRLLKLKEINKDTAGWLRIIGGGAEGPVMQSLPEERNFYLDHDFFGRKSAGGTLYLDSSCIIPEDRPGNKAPLIIYGHNMRDGSMFGDLDEYVGRYMDEGESGQGESTGENETFCIELSLIKQGFDIGLYTYKSVFFFVLSAKEFKSKDFLRKITAESREEKEEFIIFLELKGQRLTGEKINNNDNFLILVTCEYSSPDGRLFVVAKEIS